jgi:uncharacterized membrane protein YkvA (DUF1232 family)
LIWRILLGVGIGLAAAWLVLVLALFIVRPKGSLLKEAMRLLPDTLRLLRRLAADRELAHGVRVRLWLLFLYLALPIDLVPDFIPVLGYADDAIIVGVVLRSVVRRAGAEAMQRHWPGTDDGLATLRRLAGLGPSNETLTEAQLTPEGPASQARGPGHGGR